jgi:hypothetical protein
MTPAAESAGALAPDEVFCNECRAVADGLRHCLAMADHALAHGRPARAAEYLLGAVADLEPELRALSARVR